MTEATTGVLLLAAVLVAACGGPPSGGATAPPAPASVYLRVDSSAMHPGATYPTDALPDAAYTDGPHEVRYRITVSSDGRSVEIAPLAGGATMRGRLAGGGAGSRRFEIDEGAFAGGRLDLDDGPPPHGELVIFGSGVPVVSAERGALVSGR
jgi:hypothetical protein